MSGGIKGLASMGAALNKKVEQNVGTKPPEAVNGPGENYFKRNRKSVFAKGVNMDELANFKPPVYPKDVQESFWI